MGQTLTHGIYLPDEGERNCYNGLAGNWQLLDGAVGTIAEHSTQIAGKAPLVHTHTKSDVTDLLNSNFIPSANNSYDLGSSSYQWNNLYAKNYYYNGVAWGLNKSNTWSAEQTVLNNFYVVKENNYELGQSYSNGNHLSGLHIKDKNGATVGLLDIVDRSYGNMEMRIRVQQKFDPDSNNRSTSGNILYNEMIIGITPTKNNYLGFNADLWGGNTYNLGTASSKWKTLNGVNPGILSLPDLTSNGYIELSDNISANTEYSYTPPADGWLALYVLTTGFHTENAVGIFNGSSSGNAHRLACSATSGINLARSNYYHGAVILPVIAGIPYLCWIKIDSSTTLASKVLYFYKAAGNV